MGSRNGFDSQGDLDELLNVVDRGSGSVSAATRQANALTNLGLTVTQAQLNLLAGLTASAAQINASNNPTAATKLVNLTAATLTLAPATHAGKIVTVNKADGSALTLPAATGSAVVYQVYIGTTITSVGTTVKVANSSDTFVGAVQTVPTTGAAGAGFDEAAGGTDDTLTLNGTTTGGLVGSYCSFTDIAANVWLINGRLVGSGTLASSLSATV